MSQLISTVRQRWQLTIPDRVREKYEWITPGSPVSINTTDPNKIVIEPYSVNKITNWEVFWEDIKRIRSYKGEYKGSLSKFIAWDRQTRR